MVSDAITRIGAIWLSMALSKHLELVDEDGFSANHDSSHNI
jgi:hypothetical protein